MNLEPIGYFRSNSLYRYDVPRQGAVAGDNQGIIELQPGRQFEQALDGLDGFDYIWLLYWFDRNETWHPKVQPPRHLDRKVGVFASRSPYRPNPIGLSAVRMDMVDGLKIFISGHDLLDGTPILDIKPYLAYADAFPEASTGWTGNGDETVYSIAFTPLALAQLEWLESRGVNCIRSFIETQLEYEPENGRRHRLMLLDRELALAYRTWRVFFTVEKHQVTVQRITGGYTPVELALPDDKYGDKPLHREYLQVWG